MVTEIELSKSANTKALSMVIKKEELLSILILILI
jgi:hypothetical protein